MKKQSKFKQKWVWISVTAVLAVGVIACVMLFGKGLTKEEMATPKSISLTSPRYEGSALSEQDLSAFLESEKANIFDSLLQFDRLTGCTSEELRFSSPFVHVLAEESGNTVNREKVNYLIFHDQEVVGYLTVYHIDGTYDWRLAEEGSYFDDWTALLRQNEGKELAMVYFGPWCEAAISPDGMIHFLSGNCDIPNQNAEYYKVFNIGDNCVKGF